MGNQLDVRMEVAAEPVAAADHARDAGAGAMAFFGVQPGRARGTYFGAPKPPVLWQVLVMDKKRCFSGLQAWRGLSRPTPSAAACDHCAASAGETGVGLLRGCQRVELGIASRCARPEARLG